jgi:hypothetical protein
MHVFLPSNHNTSLQNIIADVSNRGRVEVAHHDHMQGEKEEEASISGLLQPLYQFAA